MAPTTAGRRPPQNEATNVPSHATQIKVSKMLELADVRYPLVTDVSAPSKRESGKLRELCDRLHAGARHASKVHALFFEAQVKRGEFLKAAELR